MKDYVNTLEKLCSLGAGAKILDVDITAMRVMMIAAQRYAALAPHLRMSTTPLPIAPRKEISILQMETLLADTIYLTVEEFCDALVEDLKEVG